MKKCKLEKEYNSCEYYERDTMDCHNDRKCCFQFEVEQPVNYERGERWYEKYTDPVKREKHKRIWQHYIRTDTETDKLLRQALFDIEALSGLPENFEIVDINYSILGIKLTYKNAWKCTPQVQEIIDALEDATKATIYM